MTSQKLLFRGMVGLICFEIVLALIYVALILQRGSAVPFLDFNGVRSLPSLLQAAHLFAIGILSLLLLIFRHRMPRPLSWFLPLALAFLCFYGGLDEVTKLHLHLDQFNWQVIYIGLLFTIPIIGWQDLRWIWCHHRSTVLWILSGLSIFLLGGFGAEALKGAIATDLSPKSPSQVWFLAEHLRITVEELAELLGETIILFAFAQFTQQTLVRKV